MTAEAWIFVAGLVMGIGVACALMRVEGGDGADDW